MRDYIEVEKLEKKISFEEVSVTCNKCGKSTILKGEDYEKEWQQNKYQSFSCYFGYGSGYDNERWDFDLCEDCLTELIKTFKYVPNGFGQDNYIAMYPQAMFDNWKKTGVIDLEAGMTNDEIEENGGSIYIDDEEDFD